MNSKSNLAEISLAAPTPPHLTSDDWNRRYSAEEFVWTKEPNRFLKLEVASLKPGRAIDLGAGEARNAVWLAEQGWTVRAVDYSSVGLEKGRRLAAERGVADKVTCEEGDLRTYVPGVRSYDLVALIYLQVPLYELGPIVKRAAEAVAPGGTFLLVAHDSMNLTHGYGGPQRSDILYRAENVVKALDNALVIERAERVEKPMQTDSGVKIALDCLVRAKRRHG